ncbi:MAG: beta-ketoacyl-ACP synthase III [Nitriliruptoraceae bacterium]
MSTIHTPTGRSQPVRFAGIASYLPERVVTNDDLAQVLDTSDEWIRTRTGIRERHVLAADQATSDLALAAARRALEDAEMTADQLTAIVVATTTPDHTVPGTAPLVAAALGTEATAFDVNAACSGFIYALRVGSSLLATGDDAVLVVGAETLSRIVDPSERSVAVLFGDGAGAAVLVPDERASVGPFDLGADGRDPSMLWAEAGGSRSPVDAEALASGSHFITMRGGDVYRNAVARMVASSQAVLDEAGVKVEDVDVFVGHQANLRILEAVGQRLGIPAENTHITVDRHGNTSAASVPLALSDARATGRLKAGDTVLLSAFGAGLTWGSCLLTWQPTAAELRVAADGGGR